MSSAATDCMAQFVAACARHNIRLEKANENDERERVVAKQERYPPVPATQCTEYDDVDALQTNLTLADAWLAGLASGATVPAAA